MNKVLVHKDTYKTSDLKQKAHLLSVTKIRFITAATIWVNSW